MPFSAARNWGGGVPRVVSWRAASQSLARPAELPVVDGHLGPYEEDERP